jgi:hypothetical protein
MAAAAKLPVSVDDASLACVSGTEQSELNREPIPEADGDR